MPYTVITGVEDEDEPVSLDEAKIQVKQDGDDDDVLIQSLITTARELAEQRCCRTFPVQTLAMPLPCFPCGPIDLEQPPVRSIGSVTYIDTAGASQVLDASAYRLATKGLARTLSPATGKAWPATQADNPEAVVIEYEAGYDKDDVPKTVKSAMLLIIGHLYANREDSGPNTLAEIPGGSKTLLDTRRIWEL